MSGLDSFTTDPPQLFASLLVVSPTGVVAVVGVLVLIIFSVCIGMSMDTERQYRAAEATAAEIRELDRKKRELVELNHRIWRAIQVLTDRLVALKAETARQQRCSTCSYCNKDCDR